MGYENGALASGPDLQLLICLTGRRCHVDKDRMEIQLVKFTIMAVIKAELGWSVNEYINW